MLGAVWGFLWGVTGPQWKCFHKNSLFLPGLKQKHLVHHQKLSVLLLNEKMLSSSDETAATASSSSPKPSTTVNTFFFWLFLKTCETLFKDQILHSTSSQNWEKRLELEQEERIIEIYHFIKPGLAGVHPSLLEITHFRGKLTLSRFNERKEKEKPSRQLVTNSIWLEPRQESGEWLFSSWWN